MFMSLIKTNADLRHQQFLLGATWTPNSAQDQKSPAGIGAALTSVDQLHLASPSALSFVLSTDALQGHHVLASHALQPPSGPALLRLDEVCFPVGAIAHRHTHSGSGIRYLARGALRIEADEHTQIMQAGGNWFEPAFSPVRAVALQDQDVSIFVRAMVIPLQDAEKSTFRLEDPADADLPRLQQTHRYFEHLI